MFDVQPSLYMAQLLRQCLKVVPATNGTSDHCALLSNRPVQRVKCKTSERTAVMASYCSMMDQRYKDHLQN